MMSREHVQAYAAYVFSALKREGIPVLYVGPNSFNDRFSFALSVLCAAPWDQYNRDKQPGTWHRTILRGETVHDAIDAYQRAYPRGN
jgi:hypothetical protein